MKSYLTLIRKKLKPIYKPIQRGIIYYTGLCFFEVIKKMDPKSFNTVADSLGKAAFKLFFKERELSIKQISEHLDVSREEAERITEKMFVHFAMNLLELFNLNKIVNRDNVDIEGEEIIFNKLKKNKGLIVVSGHIGNWELMVAYFSYIGIPLSVIMREIYDKRLNSLMIRIRDDWKVESVVRGKKDSLTKIVSVLKRKRSLGILIDQDTNVPGVFVPFFNEIAFTPIAPAQLALRFDIPIVVVYTYRKEDNSHKIVVKDVEFSGTGNLDDDIKELTEKLNLHLEAAIREHPEQWVWLHQRWKTKP